MIERKIRNKDKVKHQKFTIPINLMNLLIHAHMFNERDEQ